MLPPHTLVLVSRFWRSIMACMCEVLFCELVPGNNVVTIFLLATSCHTSLHGSIVGGGQSSAGIQPLYGSVRVVSLAIYRRSSPKYLQGEYLRVLLSRRLSLAEIYHRSFNRTIYSVPLYQNKPSGSDIFYCQFRALRASWCYFC